MLLTGFDAPIEGVMYLDKPLRDHRLVQAIARTNRPYPGKLGGIVVDYARIFDNLVKALYFQEADIKSIVSDFGQLRQEWKKTLDGLLELFPTIERKIERVHLLEAAEKLKRKEKLKFFKENFSLLKKLWETLFPDPAVTSCSKEYDWLIAVKAAYYKFYEREKVNLEEYQTKTKELIQKSFLLKEIEKEIPLLEIDADYLKKVEGEHLPEKQKVMELSSALDHHIKIDLEKHPIYRTLSQRLESILKRREEDAEKAKKLIDLVKEVNKLEEERKRLILSQEEYAVFGVLKSYLPKKKEKELVSFSKDLLKDVKENSFPGWHAKKSVIQKIEKIIFEKCIERFSDLLDPRKTLWLSEELMKYLKRYSER
jgi:type I restriction enzyme R subunit